MSTKRKVISNRSNAKKSTGPKTAVGKARSALNAVKHGLSGQPVYNSTTRNQIEKLAKDLIPEEIYSGVAMNVAREAAEAQVTLNSIQFLRHRVWGKTRNDPTITERGYFAGLNRSEFAPFILKKYGVPVSTLRRIMPIEFSEPFKSNAAREIAIIDFAVNELTKLVRYERQASNRRDRALRELQQLLQKAGE